MNEHQTNGNAMSPSQRAWVTAKEQAVAEHEARQQENRERGQREQQEMIRAVMDPNLSHGAARLFCFLLKAGWIPDFGGLYQGRVGAVMTDGRRLARYCGGASVNCLYQKVRAEKRNPEGKVLVHASVTDGWIAELVRGGYIWIGKHRIANIPKSHWPNVYNVAVHVPEKVTPHLPWLDGGFGSENVINTTLEGGSSPGENTNSRAQSTPVNGQTPKSQQARHRNGNLPVTASDNGQSPQCQLAKFPPGGLPSTASDNGQSPHRITAQHRNGNLPSTEKAIGPVGSAVDLGKTLDRKTGINRQMEGAAPHDSVALKDYRTDWKPKAGLFHKELKDIRAQLVQSLCAARTDAAKVEYKRRIALVDEALYGPKVKDDPAPARNGSVKLHRAPRMPLAKARELMTKAKAEAGL